MPVSFTDLPSELILACLEYLPYTELGACLLANRHLHSLIRNSPRTLYLAEQSLAGVDANPFHPAISGLCLEEKRALLREREDRWLFFRPVSLEYPEIDFLASRAVYWISGDYWVIGDAVDPAFPRSVGLKFLRTAPGPSQWTKASPGTMLRLVDFVAVPEELDLIAMITHSPSGQSTSSIHIHLLSFSSLSTGSTGPHPLAASSVIHVLDAGPYDGGPSVTIDISGRTLAFCMLYLSARDEDNEEGREHARRRDGLYLYDWQTGKRMTEEPLPVHHNGAVGLTFLSPDLLLLSNTSTNSLDILSIPTLTITHTLALPELQARHQLCPFQFRTLPNPAWADPRTRFSRSYTRFLPDPERTLVQCAFQTMSPMYEYTLHVFVLRRAAVLDVLARCLPFEGHDDTPRRVLWSTWGSTCTRFLDATGELSMHPCTTLTGERLVSLSRRPGEPAKHSIRVRNFAPGAVERVRRLVAKDPDGVLFTETASLRVVEADPEDEPYDIDDGLPFPPQPAPRIASFGSFDDPASLRSEMPYVETTSEQRFDYEAVEINHESIVGTRFGDLLGIRDVEVLYFG